MKRAAVGQYSASSWRRRTAIADAVAVEMVLGGVREQRAVVDALLYRPDLDRCENLSKANRLHEVNLEAGCLRALPILLLPVAGHRHEAQRRSQGRAKGPRQLETIHHG